MIRYHQLLTATMSRVPRILQEVAQSLLRMGNGGDGVGRLVMRGKTCEVKAATPKGEGFGGKKSHPQRGGGHSHNNIVHHHYRQHQQQYGHLEQQHINNHMQPPYPYTEQMGYAMVPDVISAPMAGMHSPQYHQGYHLAGVNPYGTVPPMYYHGMNGTSPVYPGMDASMAPPTSPTAPSPHYFMSPYDPAVAGATTHVQSTVVPEYYSHTSPTYTHQQPNVAFVPMMSATPVSVMQPVAPGIPGKGTDSTDSNE